MWWWTALFAAEEVFKQHKPSLCCAQVGQLGRLAIRCRVMGLLVQLRAEGPVDRGTLREGWLQNLWSGPEPHSVVDKGLSVGPAVCPLRARRETGLCNRMLAMRGMKSLRVEGPWWVGAPGSSWAKSESKQRSLFRGRSSRDVRESLRRRLYLLRFSMPVDNERRVGIRRSTVIFIHTGMCNDQTTDELPGKSPVCDLILGKVCSLIIWELDREEHWDKVKKKNLPRKIKMGYYTLIRQIRLEIRAEIKDKVSHFFRWN